MIALILAGGLGTRLKPLTNTLPKPMINIGDMPLLEHHINSLKYHHINDIWITINYLPHIITEYFQHGSMFDVNIKYSYELTPLGTAGALRNPNSTIEKELKKKPFLITYGDNFTNFDYSKIIKFHKEKHAFMTIGLFKSPEPWTAGVVEIDKNKRIIKMIEKPPREECKTDLVNAGIYVCEPGIFDYIPKGVSDFGFDIIPNILLDKKPIYGFTGNYFVQDIGTPERLKKAQKLFENQFKKLKYSNSTLS